MPARDLIVLGTSMGGVDALVRLVRGLPPDLPAALLVVEHLPVDCRSRLPEILSRQGPLPAAQPQDGERIRAGRIYVAPPDYHLVVDSQRMRLARTARENRFRPAIDPLFRSAARHFTDRVIAILLSGGTGDGVAGLLAVRHSGGLAIVQHPDDAFMADLPLSAIQLAGADHVVPVAEMPALLERLIREPVQKRSHDMTDPIHFIHENRERDMTAPTRHERGGNSPVDSCPECGGVLWQQNQPELIRFRCHVGHAYHADELMEEQAETLEAALWIAIRTFRERSTLARQLAAQQRECGNAEIALRYEEQATLAEQHGQAILQHLLNTRNRLPPLSALTRPGQPVAPGLTSPEDRSVPKSP